MSVISVISFLQGDNLSGYGILLTDYYYLYFHSTYREEGMI